MAIDEQSYKKSGVFNFSLTQATSWLSSEYRRLTGKDITYKFVGNRPNLRQLYTAIPKGDDGKPLYTNPFATVTLATMGLDPERNGMKKNLITGGHLVGKDLNTATGYVENLRATRVGLGIRFRTDTMEDMVNMAHILLMNAPRIGLVMQGAHGFRIETALGVDPELTLAESESNEDGEYYLYEFALTLFTFVGFASETRLIRTLRFNTTAKPSDIFFEGDPYFDLTQTINYTDYFNRQNSNFRGSVIGQAIAGGEG